MSSASMEKGGERPRTDPKSAAMAPSALGRINAGHGGKKNTTRKGAGGRKSYSQVSGKKNTLP